MISETDALSIFVLGINFKMNVKIIALQIGGEFITGTIAQELIKEIGFRERKYVRYIATVEEMNFNNHPVFSCLFERWAQEPILFYIKNAVFDKKTQNWKGQFSWEL